MWQAAQRVKCNPDDPQRALRPRALRDGETRGIRWKELSAAKLAAMPALA